MPRIWDDVIPESDRIIYEAAGYGERGEYGKRPAVLVIDVNYDFVGDKPEPILESIKRFHNSCGEKGWQAVYKIRELLTEARARRVPVFFTTSAPGTPDTNLIARGAWVWKNAKSAMRVKPEIARQIGTHIVKELGPEPGEMVIEKTKPAAFFGTPLHSYLTLFGIDDLIVCGTTTSGCVRASVLEAFNLNYHIQIVEECTFDRGEVSHKINLFDMNAKYADVLPLAEVVQYLRGLPEGTFADIERYRPQLTGAR